LKRRINFSIKDQVGGSRTMDYTGILNEKENQIVELEKKIQNLEERLRRASKRESELEEEIVRLNASFRKLQNPNISRADIDSLLIGTVQFTAIENKYNNLRNQLSAFAGLVNTQFEKLRSQGIRFEYESNLNSLLKGENLDVSVVNGVLHFADFREKVVEVPIQDARTKHLIHMLAVQMKKYFEKYPKLKDECDNRLFEFFQQ
jgi:DNA repair exonuclease SbcCD ATPase subunit